MKELNGKEIADYVKSRQLHVSRSLRQAKGVTPKLAIVRTNSDPVVDIYLGIKQRYGSDIEAITEVVEVDQSKAVERIKDLNKDQSVTGIIVQLPLPDPSQTDEILNSVTETKDVDGLANKSPFTPPTAQAINWLLSGYNIDLAGKKIVIIGQGRLVGEPLAKLWRSSGLEVETADEHTKNLSELTKQADILVSAAGQSGLVTTDMVKAGAVVVDAGVSSGKNGVSGDVDQAVRERDDITITPVKGGVGPLTVAALFENLLQATQDNT